MTDKKTEALKLALEALEDLMGWQTLAPADTQRTAHKAITAIREALADEALDRMAENARELGLDYEPDVSTNDTSQERVDETAKQRHEWVGLTDEEIGAILEDPTIAEKHQGNWLVLPYSYARAIEAKLKEKNT